MPQATVVRLGRRVGRALAGCAVAAVLTGCAESAPPAPIATPAPGEQAITASDVVPIDFRHVSGPGFRLGVPGGYEEHVVEVTSGVRVSQWSRPHPGTGITTALTVVTDAKPAFDAYRQGAALEQKLREEGIEATRVGVAWPGAQSAQLITWREVARGTSEARQIRQLMVQSPTGAIQNVVAFAPEGEFAASDLARAMSTLELLR